MNVFNSIRLGGKNRREASAGFTLIEVMIAGTMSLIILSSGFFLYKSQTKMSLKQEDNNESLVTIDYVVDQIRTLAISAGGGLPQMVSGIRDQSAGKGIVTYYNPNDLSTAVTAANTDSTDGVIPVANASIFDSAGYVILTNSDQFILSKINSIDTTTNIITVPAAAEQSVGSADFAYPVVYCSLYVDNSKYLRETLANQSSSNSNIPLAMNIDSMNVSYDVSSDGSGSFTNAITDSSKISRVKIYIRVTGTHAVGAGSPTRQYQTIVGIRRGRLYNRGS